MADASKSKQFLSAPTHGTVVGREAAPINTSNVGHRMLAAMGYVILTNTESDLNRNAKVSVVCSLLGGRKATVLELKIEVSRLL